MSLRAALETAKLEGRDLDYAVTLADGWTVGERPSHWQCSSTFAFLKPDDALCPTCSVPYYSEVYEGERVMRIIEINRIDLSSCDDGTWNAWCPDSVMFQTESSGPTAAIAALRAYVAAKLGRTVEVSWAR